MFQISINIAVRQCFVIVIIFVKTLFQIVQISKNWNKKLSTNKKKLKNFTKSAKNLQILNLSEVVKFVSEWLDGGHSKKC